MGMTITDEETGVVRAGRLPTNAVIDDNPDVEKITGGDAYGRETNIGNNVKGFKPVLTLTYSGSTLDLYALQRGRKITRSTFDNLILPKELKIRKLTYPGAPTGKVGYGVVKDVQTSASIVADNQDVLPLIQQPYDSFSPSTDNSFAIGANFAKKFSTNLLNQITHIKVPLPAIAARTVSEESLGTQIINIIARSSDDTVTLVEVYSAQIDPSGSKLDPKADNLEIKFDLSGLGVCEPYKVYELASTVYCDN
ncbi:hypothetical protein A6769_36005 [Nostoc punctiforme NIES-2108]|nr:hypothetical protein A6769_36005 [Nostoc punctiforme NIES-2108]